MVTSWSAGSSYSPLPSLPFAWSLQERILCVNGLGGDGLLSLGNSAGQKELGCPSSKVPQVETVGGCQEEGYN